MIKFKHLFLFISTFALVSCGGGTPSVEPTTSEEEISSVEPTSLDESSEEISSIEPCEEHFLHLDHQVDPTEEEAGYKEYQCSVCGYKERIIIPLLSSNDYEVTNLEASCNHGNGKRYSSNEYGVYMVTDEERIPHTTYGDVCETCGQLVGEFKFSNATTFACAGYPRLYQLSDYWDNAWLLGGDNGTIVVRRSTNKGVSWTNEKLASYLPNYSCANVDFFELPNHDILCSYRAIGKSGTEGLIQYNRKLHYSISHDGGETWEDGEDIVDNFQLAVDLGYTQNDAVTTMLQHGGVGFYEPYVDLINNVPTVMYADDFTNMLLKPLGSSVSRNYCSQYLMSQTFDYQSGKWSKERVAIMDGTQAKSPTGSELDARISRDGMPVYARMHDGTYVVVFEGTYRDTSYYAECGKTLDEYHPFEILMSYSRDGITWANPVEIYTPANNGSKASAPFVCVTEDDRLIVSFQTDEDAVPYGYIGDAPSVMKCMVSKPGIKIEDINRESFYGVINVNNTPVGSGSLWNGMMLIGDTLYTCSTGCRVRVSKVPVYAEAEEYEKEEIKIDGEVREITLQSDTFTCYSNASNAPTFNNNTVTIDNPAHDEQKLIFNDVNLIEKCQIDFEITAYANRLINTGLYLNARNPHNGLDLVTALNLHLEKESNSNSWSVHLYNFDQAYRGQLTSGAGVATTNNTIRVRVIIDGQNIKMLLDDMTTVAFEYDVPTNYILTGALGIRNQGLAKATISNFKITTPVEAE